ncbi:MAG: hypothetical protein LBP75_04675 [Planctomycetota bacterium]|nr:hypothetical protein [Planctomycetota bacterium]
MQKKFHCPCRAPYFLSLANPARRKINRADFPLGWAVTLCRFAAFLSELLFFPRARK